MSAKKVKDESLLNSGLVGANCLLEVIFPDPKTRPSLRWLREMQRKRLVPFRKIGRKVYFCPDEVRRFIDVHFKVESINKK